MAHGDERAVTPDELVHELDVVETELCSMADVDLRTNGAASRLLSLAAREYEVLRLLSRPRVARVAIRR